MFSVCCRGVTFSVAGEFAEALRGIASHHSPCFFWRANANDLAAFVTFLGFVCDAQIAKHHAEMLGESARRLTAPIAISSLALAHYPLR